MSRLDSATARPDARLPQPARSSAPSRHGGLAALLLAALLPALVPSAAADERTLAQSVYSAAQAGNGAPLYATHCATCHDPDYFKDVFRAWQGETMGTLFDVMAGTMPQSNPGSLMDQEYLDILAYVLRETDFPAGANNLEARGGALHEIVIIAAP